MALFTRPVRPSAAIINKNGESGSPCLNPLLTSKSYAGLPITRTDIELEKTQAFIHLLHFSWNPIQLSIYSRYFQLTESNAFSKSTFRNMHLSRLFLIRSINSFSTTTPSKICLPGMNAVWQGEMTFPSTYFSRAASILDSIL